MRALRVLQQQSESLRSRITAELAPLLGETPSAANLLAAAHRAHALLDEEHARALARSPALTPACSSGCSYCCHVHVDATSPEILAIASHLTQSLSRDDLRAFEQKLATHVARVQPMSDDERWQAKIPCALLAPDGRCSIYDVRPLRCRAFHSCSVDPCRAAFHGAPDAEPIPSPPLARAHDAVEEGYDRALTNAGISPAAQRLESALLAALRS